MAHRGVTQVAAGLHAASAADCGRTPLAGKGRKYVFAQGCNGASRWD